MSEGGIFNFNLGELSEPAKVLVEKIAEGVGGLYKPVQIKRVADAEAYAKLVTQETDQTIESLRSRTLNRLIHEEQAKQVNMESIVSKALPEVGEFAKPEDINNDWLTYFFDKARLFSDSEMQALWAKILASEANKPGSFSKRTVSELAMIDKDDAEIFTHLCSFVWKIDDTTVPLVFDTQHPIYKDNGINFSVLSHLNAIGLINFESSAMESIVLMENPAEPGAEYFNLKMHIRPAKGEDNIQIGRVFFTATGSELYKICNPAAVDGFVDYVKETWMKHGVEVHDN